MTRRQAARWAAPVAFLAAVTIAVLLVRAGLDAGGGAATSSGPTVVTSRPAATAAGTTTRRHTRTRTTATRRYYTVESGDTFGTIAARYGTTVERLEALNPGVSSSALVIGQKIRVK